MMEISTLKFKKSETLKAKPEPRGIRIDEEYYEYEELLINYTRR